jgi:hypothetical protein
VADTPPPRLTDGMHRCACGQSACAGELVISWPVR